MSLKNRGLRTIFRTLLAMPEGARNRLLGAPPTNQRGDRLDSHLHAVLTLERYVPNLHAGDVSRARAQMRDGIVLIDPHAPAVPAILDSALVGRPVRAYLARDRAAPVLLWLHGGGWAVGDLDTHDAFCRRACAETGLTVVAFDYRLAPEHPFPDGLDDVLDAWNALPAWLSDQGLAPSALLVGGDSAGGNLTAALCVRLHEAGNPQPGGVLLVYPAVDFRRQTASHAEFAAGFLLDKASMDQYEAWYGLPDKTHPWASPLLSDAPFPPAVVVTAGFDPLRDEAEALVARLEEVEHLIAADLIHGFLQFDHVSDRADQAVAAILDALRRLADRVSGAAQ